MPSPPVFDDAFRARLRVLLTWRRDVRRFRPDPLPAGALERLIEIAVPRALGRAQPALALCRWSTIRAGAPRSARNFAAANAAALAAQAPERALRYARPQARRARRGAVSPRGLRRSGNPARAGPRAAHHARDGRLFGGRRGAHACGSRRAPRGSAWAGCRSSTRMRCGAILEVPPAWKLIGYFCLGYPAEEDEAPMLETVGWETRRPPRSFLIRR